MSCGECPLFGRPKVPTQVRAKATVLVVGEAPGTTEARTGLPFQGLSGQDARRMLPVMNEATITNTVLCNPKGNLLPQRSIPYCQAHLRRLVEIYDTIFLLGAVASKAVLGGDVDFKTTKGSCVVRGNKRYYVLTHPAAMLHKPDIRPTVERQYRAAYNDYLSKGSVNLERLEPRHAGYPDGFVVACPDPLVIDTEFDGKGNVLIGVMTEGGVCQHCRRYRKVSFPTRPGLGV